MLLYFKNYLFLVFSTVMILFGSALLFPQFSNRVISDLHAMLKNEEPLTVLYTIEKTTDTNGAFPIDLLGRYAFQKDGKDTFSLLLAHYRDGDGQRQDALLFPKDKNTTALMPSSTGQREEIWQAAARVISDKAPKDAVFLSWWDDGQRIQFLSGRNAWINKPAEATFKSPLWKKLRDNMLLASDAERDDLAKMARWLTMDSDKALMEIRQQLGASKPIFLLINNDLLMRQGEMVDYGGTFLSFNSINVPASDNLHSDIAKIKGWANEESDGNYLVQKEGLYYRVLSIPKQASAEKNSLLVRLLPFVESLKKLPDSVQLVYQSKWGGYLSVYKITK